MFLWGRGLHRRRLVIFEARRRSHHALLHQEGDEKSAKHGLQARNDQRRGKNHFPDPRQRAKTGFRPDEDDVDENRQAAHK